MSRVLWASAAILIGISLTPGVALAANGNHSRSHSENNNKTGSTRATLLAVGAGYGLRHGSPAVRSLQRRLLGQGISPGPVDGRYGPLTAAAVRRFQRARGLAVDGIVGPATRRALAVVRLSEGAGFFQRGGSGAVRVLQARLRRAGFSPGPMDGRYGPRTQQAVRRFQRAHGLRADGVTGTNTQAALAAGRTTAKGSRPKRSRAHGRNPNRTAQPPAPPRSGATGNHAAAAAGGRRSTAARHRGHHSVLTLLIVIAVGALTLVLLLSGREFGRRRRLAATTSTDQQPAAAPVAIAPVPQPEPDPSANGEPGPSPAQAEQAPDEPDAVDHPEAPEVAVARLASSPDGEESDESIAEPPPVDAVRAEQVKVLQRQLRLLGFDAGPVDGRYGPHTTDAVRQLQEAAELEPDGIVGPLTAEVLRRNAPEPPADDRAERVKALQRQLGWLGYEPGPDDGRYGPLTTGAVKRFQQAHDLPTDGIVDRATADVLRASVVQRPSSDRIDRVKALQRQLVWLGLDPGAIDGRYGAQTTEAVRRFQEDHELPVSGIVDPPTQNALQASVQRTEQW